MLRCLECTSLDRQKKLKETLSKLFKCDKAKKSVEVSIESSERQV